MALTAAVVVAVAAALAASNAQAAPFNAGDYDHMVELRAGEFEVHWSIENNQDIKLAMRALTDGWVGFGLGEPSSGAMPGADIITGSVSSMGVGTLEDRFGMDLVLPELDAPCSQSWTLLNADESGGWTTIEGRRALDAGSDAQDRSFGPGTLKVLWAYGSGENPTYHGTANRGLAGIDFLNFQPGPGPIQALNNTPGVQNFFFPSNGAIPATQTYYHRVPFLIPPIASNIDGDGRGAIHLVAINEELAPLTAAFVHHLVLRGCRNTTLTGGTTCDSLYAWAPGTDPLILPPTSGFLVGQQVGAYYYLEMETHYDNPNGDGTGMVDNSGLHLWYSTGPLRQKNAACVTVGDVSVSQPNDIPRGSGQVIYKYDCPSRCTQNIPVAGVRMFASFLHMHQAGARSVITHWRNGQRLADVGRVEFWDFNLQALVPLDITLMPGDELRTTCVYNRSPTRDIPFQDASDDEMCVPFIYLEEALPWDSCGFYYDEGGLGNVTACGAASGGENPTVADDDSVIDITFGVPSVCPPSPPSSPSPSSPSPSSSPSSSPAPPGSGLGNETEIASTATSATATAAMVAFLAAAAATA